MFYRGRGNDCQSRLYIGQLTPRITEVDLQSKFCRFGRIREVDVKRGFGFVEYFDDRDANRARIEMDGHYLEGSRLSVEFAKGSRRGFRRRGSDEGERGVEYRKHEIRGSYDERYGDGIRESFDDHCDIYSPGEYGDGRGLGFGSETYPPQAAPSAPPPRGGRSLVRDYDYRRQVCYNCGREGHMARDCREGNWKNRCYTCWKIGHIRSQCTESFRSRPYCSRSPTPPRTRFRVSRSISPRPRHYGLRRQSPSSGPFRSKRRSPSPGAYRSPRRCSPSPMYRRRRSRSPYCKKLSKTPPPIEEQYRERTITDDDYSPPPCREHLPPYDYNPVEPGPSLDLRHRESKQHEDGEEAQFEIDTKMNDQDHDHDAPLDNSRVTSDSPQKHSLGNDENAKQNNEHGYENNNEVQEGVVNEGCYVEVAVHVEGESSINSQDETCPQESHDESHIEPTDDVSM